MVNCERIGELFGELFGELNGEMIEKLIGKLIGAETTSRRDQLARSTANRPFFLRPILAAEIGTHSQSKIAVTPSKQRSGSSSNRYTSQLLNFAFAQRLFGHFSPHNHIRFATVMQTEIAATCSKQSPAPVSVRHKLQGLQLLPARLMFRCFSAFILDNSLHGRLPNLVARSSPRLFLHHKPRLFLSRHRRPLRSQPNTISFPGAAA